MPLLVLVLAVIASFPPRAAHVAQVHLSAFGWLFAAEEINHFMFTIADSFREFIQNFL
jgi:hypothetical protein